MRNGQYYLTKARFESSCDMPREISFLRTRISTTKTLHDTAMLTKLNTVAMTCGYITSEGTWAINVLARRWDPVPVAV